MPKTELMDQFYLQVFVAYRLKPAYGQAIRHVLDSKSFQTGLRRAVRAFFAQYPAMAKARIKIAA